MGRIRIVILIFPSMILILSGVLGLVRDKWIDLIIMNPDRENCECSAVWQCGGVIAIITKWDEDRYGWGMSWKMNSDRCAEMR